MMYSQAYVAHRFLLFLALPFVVAFIFSKTGLASGDLNTLIYLSFGYFFFGLKALLFFVLCVLVGHLVVGLTVRGIFKIKKKYPFMPVILGSHIAMGMIYFFNLA